MIKLEALLILPAQLATSPEWLPEQRLMAAVLEEAFRCLHGKALIDGGGGDRRGPTPAATCAAAGRRGLVRIARHVLAVQLREHLCGAEARCRGTAAATPGGCAQQTLPAYDHPAWGRDVARCLPKTKSANPIVGWRRPLPSCTPP